VKSPRAIDRNFGYMDVAHGTRPVRY
jgi:hypothetical protein